MGTQGRRRANLFNYAYYSLTDLSHFIPVASSHFMLSLLQPLYVAAQNSLSFIHLSHHSGPNAAGA